MIWLIAYQYQIPAYSQDLVHIRDWESEDIVDACSDISGNIYISYQMGIIRKYNSEGVLLMSYSGDTPSPISSIDVSHSSKIFGLYRDSQSYILLDKFLNPLNQARINAVLIGYAVESAYSADNNLWIFDQSDLSVKKLSLINNMLVTSISLTLILNEIEWEIQQIEEYQNRIYFLNSTGEIFILDNLGNYVRKMELRTDSKIGFMGEYMYYVEGSGIFRYHLYLQEIEHVGRTGDAGEVIKLLPSNDLIYVIQKHKIIVFKQNSSNVAK